MQGSLKRILTGALFFITALTAATVGYVLAGWSLMDAVYMVVITTFGVGYGEVHPITSTTLRIFTIGVIVAGTSSVVYMVGGFVQMITEGEINKALGARRMTRSIETLEHHGIICGFGRMGQILARKMLDANIPCVIIDNNADRIAMAESSGYLIRIGNATDEAILHAAGIDRAKVLATVLPDDAANVFITLTARELNPKLMILARGELPSTEKKLRLAGANQVVLPAAISALRMSHMITHPATMEFFSNDDGRSRLNELLSQVDIQVDELTIGYGSPIVGATIEDIEVRGKGTFIVVALRRLDGATITHPSQALILSEGDVVIVMGHRGDIPQFVRKHVIRRPMRHASSRLFRHDNQ